MTSTSGEHISHIRWNDDRTAVIILDQTRLPGREEYLSLHTIDGMIHALRTLQVRGAPAIGIFAACSLAALANGHDTEDPGELLRALQQDSARLRDSRPTAVNLFWATDRMMRAAQEDPSASAAQIRSRLEEEARCILQEDIRMCRSIAEHGLSLLHSGDGILTHCNAGPIATSRYGTALGPVLLAKEKGIPLRVFADETRPLLQGARLTAWELDRAGVDVTLICDNMAASVMAKGWIQCCFVGCDRIAANGDTANKIGTSGVAILARHYGIPFYVLGPSSSIDLSVPDGSGIPIELRPEEELRSRWYREPMAPEHVACYNPAFDVTDHDLITGIITENGICRPPYRENLPDFVHQFPDIRKTAAK